MLVEQSDWSKPQPEAWEAEVAGAVLAHPGAVLVGHSLGAILIARLLTKWPQPDVRAVLLVAPAEPDRCERLSRFAPVPTRPLGVPATVVASRNDPWMTFGRAASLAGAWGADLIDLGYAGHINVASGFGPWPRGTELRNELLRPTSRGRDEPRALHRVGVRP